jgi:hypothetical protein
VGLDIGFLKAKAIGTRANPKLIRTTLIVSHIRLGASKMLNSPTIAWEVLVKKSRIAGMLNPPAVNLGLGRYIRRRIKQ